MADSKNIIENYGSSSFEGILQKIIEKSLNKAIEPSIEKIVDKIIERRMNVSMGEEPIDIDEAAKLVKKSKNTVYSYCSRGLIPFHKTGFRNIFYRSELLRWLKTS